LFALPCLGLTCHSFLAAQDPSAGVKWRLQPRKGQAYSEGADLRETAWLQVAGDKEAPHPPYTANSQGKEGVPKELQVFPSSITLTGSHASQRLVVEGTFEDGHEEDLTAQAKVSCSNSRVALVDNQDFVRPTGDGDASLEVSFQGRRARVRVEVKSFSAPFVWSFRNHVLPVMTKVGCNSGACHGAASGKNGFKLTLRGYDPQVDYFTLTHQALSRRTVGPEPAKSLILLKPTLTIPHGGGQRFSVGSSEYQIISQWMAAGMPPPAESDPRIVGLEVLPRQVSLHPGAEQQLLVQAQFSDGRVEDVTPRAKYTSTDEGVAVVEQNGRAKMRGYGEAPVSVWYLSRVATARLQVPFPYSIDEDLFRRAPRNNYIDELVLNKLRGLHIPPSRAATDTQFIRRAFLDAVGILPTAAETQDFLADRSGQKRAQLIGALLARPEYVDYWAYKWSDLLLVSSRKLAPAAMWSYYNWIRQGVATDKPWDQFVREIMIATGNTQENGAANYWVIHKDPLDAMENLSVAFMGITMRCAHCHNHPMERWTQADYYAMANLFSRVQLKTGMPGGRSLFDVTVISAPTGDVYHPRLGRALPPRPLDAPALALDSPEDRRAYFAEWLTSPRNPYFPRALVNRVWKNFMGRGLVQPADDLRETNPPTNEELLSALVKDFVDHRYDVKYLIRTIMNSATYQTASEPLPQNAQDDKYQSHYVIRRLPAEVLLDGICQVTQVAEEFKGFPPGTRAQQLPDTQVNSYFLAAFGRPARLETSESERQRESTVTQALNVINGETLNRRLHATGGTVDMLIKLGLTDSQVVEYLYLSTFSRFPAEAERRQFVESLATASGTHDSRRAALEDLMWAMLKSKEFMFNH
jgi:hypothetical protein